MRRATRTKPLNTTPALANPMIWTTQRCVHARRTPWENCRCFQGPVMQTKKSPVRFAGSGLPTSGPNGLSNVRHRFCDPAKNTGLTALSSTFPSPDGSPLTVRIIPTGMIFRKHFFAKNQNMLVTLLPKRWPSTTAPAGRCQGGMRRPSR